MSDGINDFLDGGSKVPSAKFETVGDAAVGDIVGLDTGQCRKFGTNDLEFWPNGDPKMQLVVTLQTDLRDPQVPDDDGRRRLYATKPSNLLKAIAEARDKAGAKLAVGGRLAVRFTGERPHEKPGFNPIKEYDAAYQPPQAAAADNLLGAQPAQQQPAMAGAAAAPAGQDAADLL